MKHISQLARGAEDVTAATLFAVQTEVAEKEKDAQSAKKLQEIAGAAKEEAAARCAKAAQEYERAFARANPGAAVMVGIAR